MTCQISIKDACVVNILHVGVKGYYFNGLFIVAIHHLDKAAGSLVCYFAIFEENSKSDAQDEYLIKNIETQKNVFAII